MVPPKLLTLPGSRGAFLCSALRSASVATRRDASTRQTPQTVVVPARIDRGPTDVLKAIAATVGTDYTAAHYKYHDDPYLLPSSNMSKRVFALAKESGRKAARYIRDKHSDYFLHQEADPFIPAFAPKLAVPEDPSKLSVEDLERAIELGDVEDAQKIYELLCLGECAMDVSIRQKLLELLCFYNSQQGPDPAFLDERWYTASSQTRELRKKVWKDGGLVDDVFNSLPDPKTPEAYSAIIRGMTKYYQVEKAWTYFQNAKKDGVLLDTETYNAIIRVVTFLKEGPERCWETILGLLSEMRQASIKPNLGTLNAVLENISSLGAWRARMDLALSTLAEFSRSGVQPCLGSYYLILNIFYKERGGVTTIIYDIIERLESDGLQEEAVDTRDTNFFVTAMDIAANKLGDLSLGQRLHQLLLTGRNYDFIGDAYKESIYYRNYFTLLHQSLPVDDFMDNYYEKLVPFIYTPEPSVMQNVLKAVDMSAAVRYIPRLWSDMIVFDHTSRQQLVETVCSMLQAHLPDIEEGEADKVLNVGRDLFDRVEAMVHERSANFVSWTGEMLGNLMMLYAHRGDLDYCGKVLAKLKDSKYEIVGLPQFASLSTYLDQLTKADQPNRQGSLPQAVEIVVYAHDCAYPEARDLALKLSDRFELDNTVRDKINLAFGEKLYPELVQEVLTEEEIYRRRRMSMSE